MGVHSQEETSNRFYDAVKYCFSKNLFFLVNLLRYGLWKNFCYLVSIYPVFLTHTCRMGVIKRLPNRNSYLKFPCCSCLRKVLYTFSPKCMSISRHALYYRASVKTFSLTEFELTRSPSIWKFKEVWFVSQREDCSMKQ